MSKRGISKQVFIGRGIENIKKFPNWMGRSLLFYKNFGITKYTLSSDNNIKFYADYAVGSRVGTYTSTSGIPDIDSSGYLATIANQDQLTYLNEGNRNNQGPETIVIQFTSPFDWATETTKQGKLFSDSNNVRYIGKVTSEALMYFTVDGGALYNASTTSIVSATDYVICCSAYGGSVNVNWAIAVNGTIEDDDTRNYGAVGTFGTDMQVNWSSVTVNCHSDCRMKKIAIFKRGFNAADCAAVAQLFTHI